MFCILSSSAKSFISGAFTNRFPRTIYEISHARYFTLFHGNFSRGSTLDSKTRSRLFLESNAPQCGQTKEFLIFFVSLFIASCIKTISPEQSEHENISLQTVYSIFPIVLSVMCRFIHPTNLRFYIVQKLFCYVCKFSHIEINVIICCDECCYRG